jgi:protein involved in polysaccharide export with SLBB domain
MKNAPSFLLLTAALGSLAGMSALCSPPAGDGADIAAVSAIAMPDHGSDYRVSPRDLVQFQIFEEPETMVLQRVSTTGSISIPMLGAIAIAGRTLHEIEDSTEKAYVERHFYVHPQVIVTVQAYSARSVSVFGQVNHPEQIALPIEAAHIGIMQAITLAEGFTRIAKSDEVRVMRTVDGHEEQHVVNVEGYLADKGPKADFQLQPDDVVFVPERVF